MQQVIQNYYLVLIILTVADIDDTRVIWIALLRHAGKNTGST